MDALPTKDSGRALVREVGAVDPSILFALDAPVVTYLEVEYPLVIDAPVATDLEAEVNLSSIFFSVSTAALSVVNVNVRARSEFFAATDAINNDLYAPTPPLNLVNRLVVIDQSVTADYATADVVVYPILDLCRPLLLPLIPILRSSAAAASKPVRYLSLLPPRPNKARRYLFLSMLRIRSSS